MMPVSSLTITIHVAHRLIFFLASRNVFPPLLTGIPILECLGALPTAETVRLSPDFLGHGGSTRHEGMTHRIFNHLIVIDRPIATV